MFSQTFPSRQVILSDLAREAVMAVPRSGLSQMVLLSKLEDQRDRPLKCHSPRESTPVVAP